MSRPHNPYIGPTTEEEDVRPWVDEDEDEDDEEDHTWDDFDEGDEDYQDEDDARVTHPEAYR